MTEVRTVVLSTGDRYEIVLLPPNSGSTLGATTLLTEVAINRQVLEKPCLLDFVVIHEFAHKRQWYSFILAGVSLFCYLAALAVLAISAFSLVSAGIGGSILRANHFGGDLINASLLALAALLCSWFVEYKADAEALARLGMGRVLDAFNERRTLPRPSRLRRVVDLLTHPPAGLTMAIFEWIHRDAGDRLVLRPPQYED